MEVLGEPFRLVAANRRDRVAQVIPETVIVPGGRAVCSVLDDQLPQFVSALPANQVFNSAGHSLSNVAGTVPLENHRNCKRTQGSVSICARSVSASATCPSSRSAR